MSALKSAGSQDIARENLASKTKHEPSKVLFRYLKNICTTFNALPKIANQPILSPTLLNITSHVQCLSCVFAKNNNVM
jgi:hypothetical protein